MDILLLLLLIHVYGAKCHTEQSTHHVMWWALPLESIGIPFEFTGSDEWSKVHTERSTHHNVVGVDH